MCLFFISFVKLLGRKGTQSVLFDLTASTLADKHRGRVLVHVFIAKHSSVVNPTAHAVTRQACCVRGSFSHDPTGALMTGTGPAGTQEDVPGTRRPGGPPTAPLGCSARRDGDLPSLQVTGVYVPTVTAPSASTGAGQAPGLALCACLHRPPCALVGGPLGSVSS